MRVAPGTLAALVVAIFGLIALLYGIAVTTVLNEPVPEARPPLQDQTQTGSKPPLRDSNVPPAAPTAPAR